MFDWDINTHGQGGNVIIIYLTSLRLFLVLIRAGVLYIDGIVARIRDDRCLLTGQLCCGLILHQEVVHLGATIGRVFKGPLEGNLHASCESTRHDFDIGVNHLIKDLHVTQTAQNNRNEHLLLHTLAALGNFGNRVVALVARAVRAKTAMQQGFMQGYGPI